MSIICNVDVELHCVLKDVGYVNAERVRWNKATYEEGSNYKCVLNDLLESISVPVEALYCKNVFCKRHGNCLESFHNDISLPAYTQVSQHSY